MKRKDMMLIAVCVVVSGVLSLVLANILFGSSKGQTSVEVVEAISADFTQPDIRYFNDQSFNPTQPIEIGDGTNNPQFE